MPILLCTCCYHFVVSIHIVDFMQELVQRKLVKSAAVCTLISRMAPVLVDSKAVNLLFSIALSTENVDRQACIVELLAVCY